MSLMGFPGGSTESTCNAGDAGDSGSMSGPGRSPGEKMATHSSSLEQKIPWTKEPDGLHAVHGD